MFGWTRLALVEGDESDVNLLSADESSSSSTLPTNTVPIAFPGLPASSAGAIETESNALPSCTPPSSGERPENRHRHRSRRHRHHSRQRLCRFKRKESNFLTAISCMFAVVLVCTSLAEPNWFYFSGGRCTDQAGQPINYLGVKIFFYDGTFSTLTDHSSPPRSRSIYHYGNLPNEVLVNCVTSSMVFVLRSIIGLCIVVILFSLTAFILHLVGPTHRVLRAFRSSAMFSILSVLICIVINGLSYLVSEQLTDYQKTNIYHLGSRVDVQFSLGFYMITAAGVISVVAVACNLFRNPVIHDHRDRDHPSYEHPNNYISISNDSYVSACSQLVPPPPPYTP